MSAPTPSFRLVEEVPSGSVPALEHPGWRQAFPWLVQGTTMARSGTPSQDLGLFSDASPSRSVLEAWDRLRRGLGLPAIVCAQQVHGSAIRVHRAAPPGLHVSAPCDGHATGDPGLVLAVTVADCVPAFLVDAERRAVALLHAGWRGVAAGILERGLAVLGERWGSKPEDLWLHLGPAICGACYEVGPEVFEALGLDVPAAARPLDLRALLARGAASTGVREERMSVSVHCTRCGGGELWSHRAGDRQRQAGFLAVLP